MFNKASSLIWLVQRFVNFVLLKNTTHSQKKSALGENI